VQQIKAAVNEEKSMIRKTKRRANQLRMRQGRRKETKKEGTGRGLVQKIRAVVNKEKSMIRKQEQERSKSKGRRYRRRRKHRERQVRSLQTLRKRHERRLCQSSV